MVPFMRVGQTHRATDALVYLTDGLGEFPKYVPDYPVLWGDIYGRVKFPFGDVVTVPIKG
jgi:predicted metal-dependent peptidase